MVQVSTAFAVVIVVLMALALLVLTVPAGAAPAGADRPGKPHKPPATQAAKVIDGPAARPAAAVRPPDASVVYADFGAEKMRLDVYLPENLKGPRPAVLFVHGGGWRTQARQDWYWWCQDLSNRGYVAFTLDYRLAHPHPAYHPYPAAVDDCQRAVRWIRANAERYHVDPDKIASIGCSAGGHLSAMLGVTDTRDNSDPALAKYSSRVNAAVDYFGPLDLADFAGNAAEPLVRQFLDNKTNEQAPEMYKEASPISHVTKDAAPFLILHGKGDLIPFRQAEKMADLLKKAGVEVTVVSPANAGHGFHWNRDTEAAKEAWQAVGVFLTKHFGPELAPAAGSATKPDGPGETR